MKQKFQYILEDYDAHILAYPSVSNTGLIRDEFISDAGNIYYSDLKTTANEISFEIEFKGSDAQIKENRRKVSKLLDMASITFDEEVYYKGRFVESGVDKRYFYEVVTYKGSSIVHLYTQRYEVKTNEITKIYNNGNLKTPIRIILNGQGSNIKISGFNSEIYIKNLNEEIIIDAEKGISDEKGINNVILFAFPYIEKSVDLLISGSGNFTTFVEFEGRVIC